MKIVAALSVAAGARSRGNGFWISWEGLKCLIAITSLRFQMILPIVFSTPFVLQNYSSL